MNIAKLLTAKHERERGVNNLLYGTDVMGVFPTGFGQCIMFLVCFTSCAQCKQELLSTRTSIVVNFVVKEHHGEPNIIVIELHSNGMVV